MATAPIRHFIFPSSRDVELFTDLTCQSHGFYNPPYWGPTSSFTHFQSRSSFDTKLPQPTPTSKKLGLGPHGFVFGPKLMLYCPKRILLGEMTTTLIRHFTFPSPNDVGLFTDLAS
ncbi:unnamed protein product [Prunus armeniaca]